MVKRLLVSLFISAFGALMFYSAYQEWNDDPVRHYRPSQAVVRGHTLSLDRNHWEAHERASLCLAIKVAPLSGHLREATVQEYFKKGEPAWNWIKAHPVGSTIDCRFSEDGSDGVWDSHAIPGSWLQMIVGALMILGGLLVCAASNGDGTRSVVIVPLVCFVFFIGGCVTAWHFWPDAVRHVKAAHWELVPYTIHGQRTVSSGKSSTTQSWISYQFRRQDYVDLVSASDMLGDSSSKTRVCRVNPEKPWQVELSWGWHPGLGSVLFPVPFLAVGIFGFLALVSSDYRRFLMAGGSGRAIFPSDSKSELLGSAFGFIFAGSIVGVFVSICAAMWWEDQPMKWFLTLFLIPFVVAAVKLAINLFRQVRRLAPGRPREPRRSYLK